MHLIDHLVGRSSIVPRSLCCGEVDPGSDSPRRISPRSCIINSASHIIITIYNTPRSYMSRPHVILVVAIILITCRDPLLRLSALFPGVLRLALQLLSPRWSHGFRSEGRRTDPPWLGFTVWLFSGSSFKVVIANCIREPFIYVLAEFVR